MSLAKSSVRGERWALFHSAQGLSNGIEKAYNAGFGPVDTNNPIQLRPNNAIQRTPDMLWGAGATQVGMLVAPGAGEVGPAMRNVARWSWREFSPTLGNWAEQAAYKSKAVVYAVPLEFKFATVMDGVPNSALATESATVVRTVGQNTVTYTVDAGGNTLSVKGSLLKEFGGGTRSSAEVQAQANAAARGLTTDKGALGWLSILARARLNQLVPAGRQLQCQCVQDFGK